MEFQFKKFENRNVRMEDRITITKASFSMGFPQKFYRDNKISNFKYVVLYWDENNKAIGVHFTNDEEEKNKFRIIVSKDGYGGGIAIKSFLKFYNINPKKYYGRYEWEKKNLENIGETYIIKLKEHE